MRSEALVAPCPRCRQPLPLVDVIIAAFGRRNAAVACDHCGTVARATWQSHLGSHAAGVVTAFALLPAVEGLSRWAAVALLLAAYLLVLVASLPLRRWRPSRSAGDRAA